jgi:uncharacterized membrane protein YphA (DoxX/SURF4 family)
MVGSGFGFTFARPSVIEGMRHLGYPLYILRLLGIAKLLGALAILTGTFPRIKEWAYPGFVFDMIGAFYSHVASGEGPKALIPLLILSFTILSFSLWRKSGASIRKQSYQAAVDSGAEVARVTF